MASEQELPNVPMDAATKEALTKHGQCLTEETRLSLKMAYDIFVAPTTDKLFGTLELDKMIRVLGTEPTSNDLKMVLDEYGSRSGKMDLAAFLDMMERQLMSRQKDEMDIQNKAFLKFLQDAFHLYDKDKDGSITKAEIKTLFNLAGEPITDQEIEEMFFMGDRNNDGVVDYDEWIALMADMENHFQV